MTEECYRILCRYESPDWFGYISNPFLQHVAARYLAWKVQRKVERYERHEKVRERMVQTHSGGGSVDYKTGVVTGGSGGTWRGQFQMEAKVKE